MKRDSTLLLVLAGLLVTLVAAPASAQDSPPNIVIIWGDDIGQSDISAYTMGLMGFTTPNIDRVAKEGMIFTDYYAEQSCTAGRSAFITGQSVFRTGLSKVGMPGANFGMSAEDPTIAELLKPMGYATGQFGKNHLGDLDDMLPSNHGFDEFYAGKWQSIYHDVMIDHDKNVGTVLDKLDELGIADNTIVMYGTDNGPHMNAWPDAAMTPFRNEKNSNWEGAYRVPAMVRWPGHIKAASVSNDIMSHMDWMPTLLAAAGDPDVKSKLVTGYTIGDMTYKVHLDGYNFLPYLTGQTDASPREEFFYFSDDGDLTALRFDNWKVVFAQQRAEGTMLVWSEPYVSTRIPWLFNLRTDPYERATITSNTYWDWWLEHAFLLVPAQSYVGSFLATFEEFPPRQKAASFTIDQVMEQLQDAWSAN